MIHIPCTILPWKDYLFKEFEHETSSLDGMLFLLEGGGGVLNNDDVGPQGPFPVETSRVDRNSFDLNPSVMVFRFGMGWEVFRSDISR